MKENNIYVFGHQNPDTDSICASLSYAWLKKAQGLTNVIPCRLGKINKETQYVLDYFNVEPPKLISNVKPQLSDLPLKKLSFPTENDSVLKVMKEIISTPGRSTPVIDANGKLVGVIALTDIISAFTETYQKSVLKDNHTPSDNIIESLSAVIVGQPPHEIVSGNLFTNTELLEGQVLSPEDFIVTSFHDGSLEKAFTNGAKNIIVSSTPIGSYPVIPDHFNGTVYLTALDPFEVIRRLTQVIPVANFVHRDKLEYFISYETIDDVKSNMLTSVHSRFPVVDEEGTVISSISKSHLLDYQRKRVILVDHNERSQSINGVDDAEIVEVIDHHRIAEISTASPLYLRIEPVGCTCTIIARMYEEKNIPIPRPIAGLMLSAILSDTLIFNSPTCTALDRKIAEKLADITSLDLQSYGQKMLIAGSNLSEMSPDEILNADCKHFTMGNYRIMVSQINTGDFKGMFKQLEPVLATMKETCDTQGLDLAVLMVTDIIMGGSEIMIAGKARKLAEAAFGISEDEFSKYYPGVFSRKKQIIPPLMNAASL